MRKQIQLLLSFLFIVGILNGNAAVVDPPESFLADPTDNASEVLAFFSSTYESATNIKNILDTSGASKGEVKNVLEKELIYISNALNGWVNVNFTQPLDISQYDFLNMDIYVVSGAFDCKVHFAIGTTSIIITPKLQEGWNRVQLKLSDFTNSLTPPALTSISQIGFINNGGYQRTVYIDNIYVSGIAGSTPIDPELPDKMAPTPSHESSKVKSIFSDAYTSFTEIVNLTGTGTLKIISVTPQEQIMKLENGLNHWSNLNFQVANFDDREYLHIDIFVVRESGNITLKFAFDDGVSAVVSKTLSPGWNHLDIPMEDFKKDGAFLNAVSLFRIIREGGYPQTIFIDNLYTYGESETGINPDDPTAPTISASTPIHDQADVKSIFSDAYTSIATLTQSNPGSPTSEMDFIEPIEGDNMIRFTGLNWTLIKVEPAIDIDDMDFIHFDVFSLGEPKIVLGLGDGGNNEGRSPWQYLSPGWNSIDLSINNVFKADGGDMTNITTLRIFSATGFPINKLYFDNIYAYKGEPDGEVITYEISVAPEPIMPYKMVKSIYSDKYTNLTELEENTIGENTKLSFPKIEVDEKVIKLFSLDDVSLRAKTTLNLSDMEFIHFNIYKKGDNDANIEIGFQSRDASMVYYSQISPDLQSDDWTYINIPIEELKENDIDCSALKNIRFRGVGDFYVDNIFAFKGDYFLGLGEEGTISINWDEVGKSDVLPDRDQAFLGVNLASASGGSVPGILGQNYTYPSVKDLQYFKSKGVRLIRFPFRWERVQHDLNGPLNMNVDIPKIKEVIAEAERLGMYVMPDMHNYCRRVVDGKTYKFGESDKLTIEHFGDVWKKLALELKDYTNIWGYDVMNEPYGLTPGVWQEAAQLVIDSIRSVDTETPIVIEGESYAAASSWPSTGGRLINLVDPSNKLIFQAHSYFDADKSGLYKLGSFDKEVSNPNQHINRLKPFVDWLNENDVKGILGEFGVPRNDARWLMMLDEVLVYLKENGVSATYWVAGNGYANDQVSVQPLGNYTIERAQMRILEKHFMDYSVSNVESIKVPEASQLRVYPNPIVNYIKIDVKKEMEVIHIFDSLGKRIKSMNAEGTTYQVNMDDVSSGIYLIQVRFKDGSILSSKVIKN